jgi:predicted nucleic-acid-binding Zn-ribbon protein
MRNRFIYLVVLIAGFILAGSTGNRVDGQMQQNTTTKLKTVTYTCPMHPEVVKDLPGKCPKCGMPLIEKKEKQLSATMYTCKMHPEVVMNEPGKCPKCGMPLVEKKETLPGGAQIRKDSDMMIQHHMMNDSTLMKKGMKMN